VEIKKDAKFVRLTSLIGTGPEEAGTNEIVAEAVSSNDDDDEEEAQGWKFSRLGNERDVKLVRYVPGIVVLDTCSRLGSVGYFVVQTEPSRKLILLLVT
jgi:hypothetical protein